jgi:hypothetical protein
VAEKYGIFDCASTPPDDDALYTKNSINCGHQGELEHTRRPAIQATVRVLTILVSVKGRNLNLSEKNSGKQFDN